MAVNYVGEELWSYFNAPWEKRVDLAWQLMEIAEQLTNNDFEFALYLLDVSFDNFAVGPRDGKVIIVDAENVLVADKRLIRQSKCLLSLPSPRVSLLSLQFLMYARLLNTYFVGFTTRLLINKLTSFLLQLHYQIAWSVCRFHDVLSIPGHLKSCEAA